MRERVTNRKKIEKKNLKTFDNQVTAHNNAGVAIAEYEYATLTVNGGKLHFIQLNNA